jgi:regulator of replication initiation timing
VSKLRRTAPVVLLLAFAVLTTAQRRRRDPLTPHESDQLREVAPEPEKKLKLYVTFAEARMVAIEQLRKDPKLVTERGPRIHDLLEDFSNIIDEMDANINDYVAQRIDLRKALKTVIEGDTNFQLRLRTLKDAGASDPEAAKEAKDYEFVLTDASEAVDGNLDNAREVLQKQIAAFEAAKEQAKKKK